MTYPLATLAPTITSAGIQAVAYNDILQSLIVSAQSIFGSDVYLGNDSQDGQLLAIVAQAIFDTGQDLVTVFNSFSPQYAQGNQLSALVQINGLTRNAATYSQATGTVVGTVGSKITNGVVSDVNGNLWNLPTTITIPSSGSISVVVQAQQIGNIIAPIGSINGIVNPQFGWQSFTSTAAATPGVAIESDAALSTRQSISTTIASQTLTQSILAALINLTGVTQVGGYDNDSGATDSNGVPTGALACVVGGGVSQSIVNLIATMKPPGCSTYGNASGIYIDSYGVPHTIKYSTLSEVNIYFSFSVKILSGWLPSTLTLIETSLVNFINGLSIGEKVYATQALGAASLNGNPATLALSQTFSIVISTFFLGTSPSPTTNADITSIAFNAEAITSTSNISITLI